MFPFSRISAVKRCYLKLCCVALILVNAQVLASECSVLRLQKMRSVGTAVINNACAIETDLGINSVLELQGGTRFWLESPEISSTPGLFQVICQNQSAAPVKVRINSPILPWIAPVDLADCNAWVDNQLACHPSLRCAIAQKAQHLPTPALYQKTSVTMRSVRASSKIAADTASTQWAAFVKPGVELCRKVTTAHNPITLSWQITPTGEVSEAAVVSPEANPQFAGCALEALHNSQFPVPAEAVSVSYQF